MTITIELNERQADLLAELARRNAYANKLRAEDITEQLAEATALGIDTAYILTSLNSALEAQERAEQAHDIIRLAELNGAN